MPQPQERILWWPYLRFDQKLLSRLAEYDDVSEGPLFSRASGSPNPKPTTDLDKQQTTQTNANETHKQTITVIIMKHRQAQARYPLI